MLQLPQRFAKQPKDSQSLIKIFVCLCVASAHLCGTLSPETKKSPYGDLTVYYKKRQAPCIAPLQPYTFAVFPPWRILQELVVQDLPLQRYDSFVFLQTNCYI